MNENEQRMANLALIDSTVASNDIQTAPKKNLGDQAKLEGRADPKHQEVMGCSKSSLIGDAEPSASPNRKQMELFMNKERGQEIVPMRKRRNAMDISSKPYLPAKKNAGTTIDSATATSVKTLQNEVINLKQQLKLAKEITSMVQSHREESQILVEKAMEDCERHKEHITAELKAEYKDRENAHRAQLASLTSRIRCLERQRSEFIAAYKGQLRYIEILQKQKLHAEAAVLLNFTEDEFLKIMDNEK